MPQDPLQQLYEITSDLNLKIKINDNCSTMLSVRWEPDHTRVSLHRMFLQAPKNVMEELACYIKQKGKVGPEVKAFIESNLPELDYSSQLNPKKLQVAGNVYNLREIYDNLNSEYFNEEVDLFITWFGKPGFKPKSKLTFGLYQDPLKLIKINRLLDSILIPDYFISFVVYHEMLHKVCRSFVDERGINHSHTLEFKEREREFKHYELSQEWIENNKMRLFA